MRTLQIVTTAFLLSATANQAIRASSAAPPAPAPADSSVLVLAGPGEPGERLIVSGRLLDAAGRRAMEGQRVGVYHTDASGNYGEHPSRTSFPAARAARLSGWLVTGDSGRFEIRTIRPGPYPGGRIPQHIHFIVGGHTSEIRFADDPVLRKLGARSFETDAVIVRPVVIDARRVQHVTVDLRMP